MEPLNLREFEAAGRSRLDPAVYDYFAGGADDELTLRGNEAVWGTIPLRYRVMRGIETVDPSVRILGQRLAFPVIVAPMAFQAMAHPDGERATTRATAAAGSLMTLSTVSTTPLEEVTSIAGGAPVWFQLYLYRDPEVNRELLARAEAAGCRGLVLTADAPAIGNRERDERNRFCMPPGMKMANFMQTDRQVFPGDAEGSGLAAYAHRMFKMALGWNDLEWVCSRTKLPVVLKGVVRGDDAAEAVARGAAAIQVSNHGGRQLDGAVDTATALVEVAEAIRGRVPLIVDGGVRRGTDVLRALALGADAVAVGRPVLWGLAADGESGVRRVLGILEREIRLAMLLAGCPEAASVDRGLLGSRPGAGTVDLWDNAGPFEGIGDSPGPRGRQSRGRRIMSDRAQQLEKMGKQDGFIAALDQSGGSTPKALAQYGVADDAWSGEDEMFRLVHEMRSRIITSPAFNGERILAAILFENTMDREIEGKPTADYLWNVKRVVPILKVDKGLAPEENGVQLMKPMPDLDGLLEKANTKGIFGTKMRSVIKQANPQGIEAIVDQQFTVGNQILDAGLVPILEPEVDIHCPDKAKAEGMLKAGIMKRLGSTDRQVMFKLTLPEEDNLYRDLIEHPKVLRVVALSGGYSREEANARLARNHGMIASFSRALVEGLTAQHSDEEFNRMLDTSIESIFQASKT